MCDEAHFDITPPYHACSHNLITEIKSSEYALMCEVTRLHYFTA